MSQLHFFPVSTPPQSPVSIKDTSDSLDDLLVYRVQLPPVQASDSALAKPSIHHVYRKRPRASNVIEQV